MPLSNYRIFQEPGLHTDTSNPGDVLKLKAFKWIVQQTQNGTNPIKGWNLQAYKNAGFKTGVWGVTYGDSEIPDCCNRLLATAAGADLMVMNAEYQLTVPKAQLLVAGLKPFTGPKALITLVGDLITNKSALKVLLDADWDIIGEMYLNDQPELTAAECEFQAANAGIPADRYSNALGMYWGLRQRFVTGAEYAASLQAANSGKRFSLWMVEQGPDSNWAELSAYLATIRTTPVPLPTIAELNEVARRKIALAAMEYEADMAKIGKTVPLNGRIPHAKRIVLDPMNKYTEIQAQVRDLLTSIGA